MSNTDAVAVALVAADGVIDKMELDERLSSTDHAALAEYQANLAAGPTSRRQDINFLRILEKFIVKQKY